jgi:hypothetical protein
MSYKGILLSFVTIVEYRLLYSLANIKGYIEVLVV